LGNAIDIVTIEDFTQTFRRAAILSPHPDDAAFSVGGLLHRRCFSSATIVTIFGKTNFLGVAGFQSEWHEATGTRKREDEAFARLVGATLIYRCHPEAALRVAPCEDVIFNPATDPLCPPGLADDLAEILVEKTPDLILAPLGLGGHIDHLLVRSIAPCLAETCGAALGYYEDLPYAGRIPLPKILGLVSEVNSELAPIKVNLAGSLQSKLKSLSVYQTQTVPATVDVIRQHAMNLCPLDGAERLWHRRSL
jgi:LmbE family N-acetylglucosaminyl deacetylase